MLEQLQAANPDQRRFRIDSSANGAAEIYDLCAGLQYTVFRTSEIEDAAGDEWSLLPTGEGESWVYPSADSLLEHCWEELRLRAEPLLV